MSQNFSLDESYRDDEPTEAGSNRAFGSTVGGILMAVAATKVFVAGTFLPIAWLMFVAGTVLLSLGIIAPSRLSALNKFWLKIRAVIGKVANPVILALLFFLVVTPMALVMRIAGRRPLRLAPDRASATYWLVRERSTSGSSNMRQQF